MCECATVALFLCLRVCFQLVLVDLGFGICSYLIRYVVIWKSLLACDEANLLSLRDRYDVKLNNAILAEDKHLPM